MLHVWSIISIFIITICSSSTLNILQIVPIVSDHQLSFNIRIAEILATAGHHVTLLLCEYNNNNNNQSIVTSTNINIQYLPIDDEEIRSEITGSMQSDIDSRAIDSKRPRLPALIVGAYRRGQLIRRICQYHLSSHQSILAQLHTASSSFQLAIVNADDYLCGLGIVRHLHIANYVLVSSGALTESLAWMLQVPTPYSYVPSSRSRYADRMRFRQRMHNFVYSTLLTVVERYVTINQQQSDIGDILGDDNVGNLEQMLETVPLIFVNTEPLIDYQRPYLHKIVHVGGIGRQKPSTSSVQSILNTFSQTQEFVLISVGTIGEKWQKSLLKAIQQFPDYLFIWLIDDDNNMKKQSNLLMVADRSPTLQLNLLHDARIRLFIADGSYDSLLNGAYAGVPMMTIPMLADQHKYSRLAEEIGIGVMCNSSVHLIADMHRAVGLNRRARAIAQMLAKKVPSDDESMFVRWIEFIGEFGRIDALQVHANQLNIIEYFNVDVIAVLLVAPFIAAYLMYRLILVYYWSCCRMSYTTKPKRD